MYKCLVCKKEFRGRQKSKANKFCSKECQFIGFRKRINKKCLNCGKIFIIPICRKKTAKYCSKKCHNMGEIEQRENTCLYCKKVFNSDISRPRKYCSPKCRYMAWRGEGSPTWKGGVSFEDYPPEFSKHLRIKIKERDGWKCQICSVPEKECRLPFSVHHVDYNKKNCKESNLINLCHSCHLKTNTNREFWKIVLQNKKEKIMGGNDYEAPAQPAAAPSK